MKALVLVGKNVPLDFQDIAEPQAQAGETVVTLKAAALNHRDVWITKGLYAGIKFPTVLGSDGAGLTVDNQEVIINPGINWGDNERFQSSEYEILGLPRNGTFAEKVVVPTAQLVAKPAHLTFEAAAALPLAGLTAWRALFSRCGLQTGERVLISGIGGGVALFALQFAVAAGCEVWVTSSSQEKIDKAIGLGAKGGALYTAEGWAKIFGKTVGNFDVIIDSAAGSGFGDLVKLCKSGARICFYGGTRGEISGVSPQIVFYKQISIFGSTMGSTKEFIEMVKFVEAHQIQPVIDSVYPLHEGNIACKRMNDGQQFGKIVLSM